MILKSRLPWRDDEQRRFHNRLEAALKTHEDCSDLAESALYACQGGKQIRPALLLASAKAYRLLEEQVLPFMVAAELIHNYSLVHDDLPAMDDAELRHGKPAVHKVVGEGLAVLVGDFLLNRAYEVLLSELSRPEELRAAMRLAKAAGGHGMVAGQWLDLKAEGNRPNDSLSKVKHMATAETIRELKTSALISACLLLPLDLANAPHEDYEYWVEFANYLGNCFQLKDDLLDRQADSKTLGKSSRLDQNKLTEPQMLGLKEAELNYRGQVKLCLAAFAKIKNLPGLNCRDLEEWLKFLLERQY